MEEVNYQEGLSFWAACLRKLPLHLAGASIRRKIEAINEEKTRLHGERLAYILEPSPLLDDVIRESQKRQRADDSESSSAFSSILSYGRDFSFATGDLSSEEVPPKRSKISSTEAEEPPQMLSGWHQLPNFSDTELETGGHERPIQYFLGESELQHLYECAPRSHGFPQPQLTTS
jgi:hypothetical protein